MKIDTKQAVLAGAAAISVGAVSYLAYRRFAGRAGDANSADSTQANLAGECRPQHIGHQWGNFLLEKPFKLCSTMLFLELLCNDLSFG
jgi:hypothetical protein